MTGESGPRLAGDAVVRKLVTFGRILREAGVEVGPGRLQDALRALDAIDLSVRDDVYAALACTLVAKHDDLEIFDRAFRATTSARRPMLKIWKPMKMSRIVLVRT